MVAREDLRIMRVLVGTLCGLLLVGCGSAREICGDSRFGETDRVVDSSVVTAGRLTHRDILDGGRDNQVYREEPRAEAFSRDLTFRCK